MWYIVVFQPSKCKKFHFQPQIWSIWPIFPNDSESLPKVCYKNWKNSEILSKLRISEPAEVSDCNLPKKQGFCYEKVSTEGIVLQYTEGGLFPYLVFNFNMVLGSKNKNLLKCALSLLCLRIRLAGSRYDKYLINLSREQLSFFVS